MTPNALSTAPLPSPISRRTRLSGARALVGAAGLGAASCAYAGMYPPFDDWRLAPVLGLSSLVFAGCVLAFALRARSRFGAAVRALALAAMLGFASTILPAFLLVVGDGSSASDRTGAFAIAMVFGAACGLPTGFAYGVPLAVLAAVGHRSAAASTIDGDERAARAAGAWLAGVASIALTCALSLHGVSLSAIVGAALSLAGAAVAVVAHRRVRARAAWLDDVARGRDPSYRLRPMEPRDALASLPRLANGSLVVELVPRADAGVTGYRAPAAGLAVAVVSDELDAARVKRA